MSNNKSKSQTKKQIKKKNSNWKLPIIIIAIAGVLVLISVGILSLTGKDESGSKTASTSNSTNTKDISNNKENIKTNNADPSKIVAGIEIKKDDISAKAKFYDYDAEGIKMEVVALKAQDGTIRTAFNTCQVCYPSGKGYYIQEGDELVCQNCGNRFPSNKVGLTKGGCNPVPIPNESKLDDGTTIKIDKGFLDKNKAYFSNWKA